MLFVSWLSAPWRLTRGLLTGLARTLAGRRTQRGVVVLLVAGVAVAATRAAQQGHWMVGGALVFVGLAAGLSPLADAVISRRVEYTADRFAADCGLAAELTIALRVLDDGHPAPRGWSRLLSSHPTSKKRITETKVRELQDGPGSGPGVARKPASSAGGAQSASGGYRRACNLHGEISVVLDPAVAGPIPA